MYVLFNTDAASKINANKEVNCKNLTISFSFLKITFMLLFSFNAASRFYSLKTPKLVNSKNTKYLFLKKH